MKILFIADIVAKPGRETVKKLLPGLKKTYEPDIVLANAENLSHGDGFSLKNITEMRDAGVDYFTSGNHVWSNKDGAAHFKDSKFPVIRPSNYALGVPGRGHVIIDVKGKKLLLINLIGRVFMPRNYECPFREADAILEKYKKKKFAAIFVDFHAEATSEKKALSFYLEGKVSAIVGTHTHVQTNDAHIMNKGTAYISDAGMTGSFDSVIGVKKETVIEQFLTQMPVRHEPETHGKMYLSGVLVEIDDKTKKALNIKNIKEFI